MEYVTQPCETQGNLHILRIDFFVWFVCLFVLDIYIPSPRLQTLSKGELA